jgi:hypothetical protein
MSPACAGEIDVVLVVEVVEVEGVVDDGAGAALFSCLWSQESNAAGSITTA